MCLIIEKPVGQTIPLAIIQSAATRNSDGVGIMVDGEFDKWLTIKPETIKAKTDALIDKNIGVHFRMATDGDISRKNAHPFKLGDDTLLMHNGIISGYRPTKAEVAASGISDTVNFIHRFVNPQIKTDGALCPEKVSDAAGYSAFLRMLIDGTTERFGDGWVKHFDLWFSNEYAWDSPTKQYKQYTAQSYWKAWDKGAGGSGKTTLAFQNSETKSLSTEFDYDDIAEENYIIGENIREHVLGFSGELNLGYSDVSYDDGDALDEVFAGTISMDTFLTVATAATIVKVFSICCREFPLARYIDA